MSLTPLLPTLWRLAGLYRYENKLVLPVKNSVGDRVKHQRYDINSFVVISKNMVDIVIISDLFAHIR